MAPEDAPALRSLSGQGGTILPITDPGAALLEGSLTQVITGQHSQLLGLIYIFIVHVHLFNRSGPRSQCLPKRDNHPSFHSCDIIRSYFTDMMSLLRNTTSSFQKVFINAEVFCFFSSGLARTSGAGKLQSPEIFTRCSRQHYNPQYFFEEKRTDNSVGKQKSQLTATSPSTVQQGRRCRAEGDPTPSDGCSATVGCLLCSDVQLWPRDPGPPVQTSNGRDSTRTSTWGSICFSAPRDKVVAPGVCPFPSCWSLLCPGQGCGTMSCCSLEVHVRMGGTLMWYGGYPGSSLGLGPGPGHLATRRTLWGTHLPLEVRGLSLCLQIKASVLPENQGKGNGRHAGDKVKEGRWCPW